MPNNTNNIHENEAMHMVPFVELEFERYKASKQKNRIVYALAVTNIAWFALCLAYIIIIR